jgi:heme-degrading monooxygenase HmoA
LLNIVWEFEVKPERIVEFERRYGADGDWAILFRKSPHYQKTVLTRDLTTRGRYLLTDVWDDYASFENFKAEFRGEYDGLDKQCEDLTITETRVGNFETI